jgi:hypothetical protein
MRSLVSIVEGQSEEKSTPILLRRILQELGEWDIQPARPFRVKRNKVVKKDELERAVKSAINDRENPACVLVLMDADDDLPCELGPKLLERCKNVTGLPSAVVIANKEFESWFLGAKESLRGVRSIRADASAPPDPESIRGAKGKLSQNMTEHRYIPTIDQPALADRFDMNMAEKNCPSFNKLLREVKRLINESKFSVNE